MWGELAFPEARWCPTRVGKKTFFVFFTSTGFFFPRGVFFRKNFLSVQYTREQKKVQKNFSCWLKKKSLKQNRTKPLGAPFPAGKKTRLGGKKTVPPKKNVFFKANPVSNGRYTASQRLCDVRAILPSCAAFKCVLLENVFLQVVCFIFALWRGGWWPLWQLISQSNDEPTLLAKLAKTTFFSGRFWLP